MALTAWQRKRVAWLIDGHLTTDDDEAAFEVRREQSFAALSSPEEMFLFASESHTAQTPSEWRRVLESPVCDMGTALLVFWRNSPVSHYGEEPAGGWDRERHALVREIERRYRAGDYPFAVVRFNPSAFKRINFLRGHTPEELERVPEIMRRPSEGEPVPPLTREDFEWGDGF